MKGFNKTIVLVGSIFFVVLIVGCVKVTTTPITSQPPVAQDTQQATPSQPSMPETAPKSAPTTPTPSTPIFDITALKCDGTTYSFAVKPKHALVEISVPIDKKQNIMDLKSEGLIEAIVEIAANDGISMLKRSFSYGSGGKGSGSFMPGWSILIADYKRENEETVFSKVKERTASYGISGLTVNFKEQDEAFQYMCKVIIPKNTGRITLYSNIQEASFTVKGPAEYSGSGVCWTKFEAPAGEYTITWNNVAGYTAPGSFMGSASQPITMTLQGEGHLKLGGNYRSDKQAETGMLIVITNLPEAKFTITGPASYSGSGTCWAQANAPLGQYEVVFEDMQGYEFPFSSLDKRQTAFVDASFLRTVEVEYKKIGEES